MGILAQQTARYVEEAGRKAILMSGDVSDPAHCRAIIARAVEEFGKVDVLVSNAAFQMTRDSLEDIPDEEWTTPSARTSARSSTSRKRPSHTWRRARR